MLPLHWRLSYWGVSHCSVMPLQYDATDEEKTDSIEAVSSEVCVHMTGGPRWPASV
jgi:hypothetical protein